MVHNHAAYTADDVDDARRGHPAYSLAAYAQSRGLEPLDRALVGHMGGLNPLWIDYVFNAMRGELVPGRFGTVQHELDQVELGDDGDPRQSGSYYGRRSVATPGLGSLIGWSKDPPNEPFAAQAMWLPTTGIKLLVPEAAVIPRLALMTTEHLPFTTRSLAQAPSFGMSVSGWVSDELRDAVGAAVGPILQTVGTTYARLELSCGALGLRVDGYRTDPADLDRLVAITAALADAFARLAQPWWSPGPFDQWLPAYDSTAHPPGYRTFVDDFDQSPRREMDEAAARLGLAIEDPVALHRRFPRLRLPGTSMGVLAGRLPGSAQFGRLTWQTQAHPGSSAYLRRAAIVAAPPDAAGTPLGGVLVPDTDMYVVVADGLSCCWTRTNSVGRLDVDDLAARALATFRAAGASPT